MPCEKSRFVAKRFYLDASALAKRYVVEQGTFVVNHLFRRVARDAMMCLTLGTLEVLSIFVRKKNASTIPHAAFDQAMTDFRSEVIDAAVVRTLAKQGGHSMVEELYHILSSISLRVATSSLAIPSH